MRVLELAESSLIYGGTTTLPTVTVTAPRPETVSGDSSSYAIYFDSGSGGGGGGGDPLDDHAGPIDDTGVRDFAGELLGNPEFLKLPEALRDIVLDSPRLTAQLADVLAAGVTINMSVDLGAYQAKYDPNTNTMYLDKSTMDNFSSDPDYASRILVGTLAHEVAHAMDDVNGWVAPASSLNEFIANQLDAEARAMINTMLVASQIENSSSTNVITTGYATDGQLTQAFNSFAEHRNIDTLTAQFESFVRDTAWVGGTDKNGDGNINQEDKFIEQYQGGAR